MRILNRFDKGNTIVEFECGFWVIFDKDEKGKNIMQINEEAVEIHERQCEKCKDIKIKKLLEDKKALEAINYLKENYQPHQIKQMFDEEARMKNKRGES